MKIRVKKKPQIWKKETIYDLISDFKLDNTIVTTDRSKSGVEKMINTRYFKATKRHARPKKNVIITKDGEPPPSSRHYG